MTETGGSFGGKTDKKVVGAGGTPGGIGEFFLGLALAAVGAYLLFNQVHVRTSSFSFFHFGGGSSFGISLIPLLLGVGILFFSGRSTVGWVLTVGGFLFIVVGVIANMDIYFQRTSLFNTLVMLVLLAAGMGLIVRSLRPH
jgi:uncharacterized protein